MMSISCQSVVTGLCYVHPTRVLWVAAGGRMPVFIEPKIGVNVRRGGVRGVVNRVMVKGLM